MEFQSDRAPTVPENETRSVPIKHNFSETFERNTFLGKVSTPKRMKKGRLWQDDKGNPTDFEDVEVKKGCVNPEFFQSTVSMPKLSQLTGWRLSGLGRMTRDPI